MTSDWQAVNQPMSRDTTVTDVSENKHTNKKTKVSWELKSSCIIWWFSRFSGIQRRSCDAKWSARSILHYTTITGNKPVISTATPLRVLTQGNFSCAWFLFHKHSHTRTGSAEGLIFPFPTVNSISWHWLNHWEMQPYSKTMWRDISAKYMLQHPPTSENNTISPCTAVHRIKKKEGNKNKNVSTTSLSKIIKRRSLFHFPLSVIMLTLTCCCQWQNLCTAHSPPLTSI